MESYALDNRDEVEMEKEEGCAVDLNNGYVGLMACGKQIISE